MGDTSDDELREQKSAGDQQDSDSPGDAKQEELTTEHSKDVSDIVFPCGWRLGGFSGNATTLSVWILLSIYGKFVNRPWDFSHTARSLLVFGSSPLPVKKAAVPKLCPALDNGHLKELRSELSIGI